MIASEINLWLVEPNLYGWLNKARVERLPDELFVDTLSTRLSVDSTDDD